MIKQSSVSCEQLFKQVFFYESMTTNLSRQYYIYVYLFFLSYSHYFYVFCVVSVSVPAVPPTERPGETGPRFGIVACPYAAIGTSVFPDGTPERTTPSAVLVSRRGAAVCVRLPCGGRRDCEGRTSRRTQISSHVGRDVPSSRSRAAHRHAPRSSVAAADGGIFVPDFNRRCKNCESFGLYTVSCSIKLHNIEYL